MDKSWSLSSEACWCWCCLLYNCQCCTLSEDFRALRLLIQFLVDKADYCFAIELYVQPSDQLLHGGTDDDRGAELSVVRPIDGAGRSAPMQINANNHTTARRDTAADRAQAEWSAAPKCLIDHQPILFRQSPPSARPVVSWIPSDCHRYSIELLLNNRRWHLLWPLFLIKV